MIDLIQTLAQLHRDGKIEGMGATAREGTGIVGRVSRGEASVEIEQTPGGELTVNGEPVEEEHLISAVLYELSEQETGA